MITVQIIPAKNRRYTTLLDGVVLVEADRDPEFSTCRVLVERGLSGPVGFYWSDRAEISLIIPDMGRGSGYYASDPPLGRPSIKKWHPSTRHEVEDDVVASDEQK